MESHQAEDVQQALKDTHDLLTRQIKEAENARQLVEQLQTLMFRYDEVENHEKPTFKQSITMELLKQTLGDHLQYVTITPIDSLWIAVCISAGY